MKNRLLLFMLMFVGTIGAHAQSATISVNVEKAGTLQELLSKEESLRINNLRVTGEINGADIAYITKMTGKLINLQSLDISEVKLIPGDQPYRVLSGQGSDLHTYTGNYYISETNWDGETSVLDKTTNYYRNNLACAFCGITTLKEVKLPKTLPAIGEEMFSKCEALTTVEFPENLKEIGYSAFYKCKALSVTVPAGLEKIDFAAFSGCTALKGDLDLSMIKELGRDAFERCSLLTSVTLSADLDKIEEYAFYECKGLAAVTFTTSTGKLKEIGEHAFGICKALTSIDIPEGVESIGSGAFSSSALVSVVIPASVSKIGENAFASTPWWEEQEKTTKEGLIYISNVAYKWMGTMAENTSVTFKDGTTGVSDKLFRDQKGLVSVSFPSTVKSIGNECFYNCKNLQTAEFNEGLTSIGDRAFYNCSGLASVTIPSTVAYLGNECFRDCLGLVKVNFNAKSCSSYEYGVIFQACKGLESVVVGEGVESIPEGIFGECSGLTSVTFPESLKVIGKFAFNHCSGLKDVVIPNCVTKIAQGAFNDCSGLKELTLGGDSLEYIGQSAFYNNASLEEITIPKNVRYIGNSAFSHCTNLTKVYYNAISCQDCHSQYFPFRYCTKNLSTVIIGDEVELIPANLFAWCSKLSSVTFTNPDKMKYIGLDAFESTQWNYDLPNDVVTYVGPVAYLYKGEGLIEVKEGTTAIAARAFKGAKSIKLPNSLKLIGEWAFLRNYCDSIVIPKNVETIMEGAFAYSFNLKSLTLPEGLDSIPDETFMACRSMTMLHIPASVKTIGKEAFSEAYALKEVYCDVETPIDITGKDVFLDSAPLANCKLYVPTNSVDLYKAAEVWKDFDVQDIASGVESIKADSEIEIIPSRGNIIVKGNNDAVVSVYTTTGQLVFQGNSSSIALPAGLYIVKVDALAKKVIVR